MNLPLEVMRTRGVVGGPHKSFTQIGKQFQETHFGLGTYFSDEVEQYWKELTVNLSVPLLGNQDAWMMDAGNGHFHNSTESFTARRPPKNIKCMKRSRMLAPKLLTDESNAEIVVNAKNGQIESISIQEEVERSIIERSVEVNVKKDNCCQVTVYK